MVKQSASVMSACSRGMLIPLFIARLSKESATALFACSFLRNAFTASSSSAALVTAFSMWSESALSARIRSPVNSISAASVLPMSLVRRCVPPPPGIIARFISGNPNEASSDANLKSHASAISNPPPRQYPLIFASTGFLMLSICIVIS